MSPQELLRIAKNINPQKLEADPQAALEDAYIVWEAVRLVELEKVSVPNYLPPNEPPEPREVAPYPPKRKQRKEAKATLYLPKSTVDHFRVYLKKNEESITKISKKLKISSATVYSWLSGRTSPSVDNVAKVEAFLHDVGYYE
jgi:hypothetical protein